MIRAVEWVGDAVMMLDQRRLPAEVSYQTYRTAEGIAEGIQSMVVRGAPAIGIAASMGMALEIQLQVSRKNLDECFSEAAQRLLKARPTARNLSWALERMSNVFERVRRSSLEEIQKALRDEALAIQEEDLQVNRRIGMNGQTLLRDGTSVLTHCNTGALATGGYGTALGIIRAAVEEGKSIHVFADETRPLLQGARLTMWEMKQEGIPCTLITDSMAAHFMKEGRIDAVIVGADRVARNGDVANKIGTYGLAFLARGHGIPFYVASPLSTIDCEVINGDGILIEYRDASEVTELNGIRVAPADIEAENPAFDVTPAHLVSALVTEIGIVREPFEPSLLKICRKTRA